MKINDLKIGDEVVIETGNAHQPYYIGKVEKITATQITIDKERYNKRNGVKIGEHRDTWSTRRLRQIAQLWGSKNYGELMTIEEARRENQAVAQEQRLKGLAVKIKDATIADLKRLGADELQAFVEKLEAARTTNETNQLV